MGGEGAVFLCVTVCTTVCAIASVCMCWGVWGVMIFVSLCAPSCVQMYIGGGWGMGWGLSLCQKGNGGGVDTIPLTVCLLSICWCALTKKKNKKNLIHLPSYSIMILWASRSFQIGLPIDAHGCLTRCTSLFKSIDLMCQYCNVYI